jgi:hypothetical protein
MTRADTGGQQGRAQMVLTSAPRVRPHYHPVDEQPHADLPK